MTASTLAVALAAGLSWACYSPRFDRCAVTCGEGAEPCPSGTSCQAGYCLASGAAPCPGTDAGGDAPAGDGMGADAALPLPGFVQLSVGGEHSCAIDDEGALWCWGRNDSGELGIGSLEPQGLANRVGSFNDWIEISAGDHHTCGIRGDRVAGTGGLWCWGLNGDGQVGNGVTSPAQQLPAQVDAAGMAWRHVAAGGIFTCGIRADGSLWCWGDNVEGQLAQGAIGTPAESDEPLAVASDPGGWTALTAGQFHVCGMRTGNQVVCWGFGDSGRLGYGDEGSRASVDAAVAPPATTAWVAIEAGGHHTCGTATDGNAYCWGSNGAGQVWGSDAEELTPVVTVAAGSVSAGFQHTCVVGVDEVTCWGGNASGQCAGDIDYVVGPQVTPLSGVLQVSGGYEHSCARLDDGTVRCWGNNGWGQIGDGNLANKRSPVRVGEAGDPWSRSTSASSTPARSTPSTSSGAGAATTTCSWGWATTTRCTCRPR